jgi:serine/threonine protein phosphatase PrpC
MSIEYTYARALASDRRNAEDRAELFASGQDVVIVVADGAGGIPGGRSASDALVDVVLDEVQRTSDAFDPQHWANVFHETDTRLAAKLSGETTGVVVVLGERGLIGVSAGDSEAWIVRATSFDDLTVHQRVARLGSGTVVAVAFARPSLDGTLVVGSDGLFKYAAADDIAAIVRSNPPSEAARKMSELVRLSSGRLQDDFAVVVAQRRR